MEAIKSRLVKLDSQYLTEIETAYQNSHNVLNISAWYNRLDHLTQALVKGQSTYRQIEDHIFELKVIYYIHESFDNCEIKYEPPGMCTSGKNCDIEVVRNNRRFLIEAKCFHPDWMNTEIPHKYITENTFVIMDGTSYHTFQSTRGHLIDVAYHTEEKINNYNGDFISVLAVPINYHLNIEDFRDFVFIYFNEHYRSDDPLGRVTMHNLPTPFNRSIKEFWAFPFPQTSFHIDLDKNATVVAPLMHLDKKVRLN